MEEEYVEGRPDFQERTFGVTRLRKFPPFVYSLLGGMLVHSVSHVEAQWYAPEYGRLRRLPSPRLTVHANCGAVFYAGRDSGKRAQACVRPRADAVMCGRCRGEGAVLVGADRASKRRDARRRLGCVMEVEG